MSWGEYQTKIGMPAGVSPPYEVVMTFDAVTTIVSYRVYSDLTNAVHGVDLVLFNLDHVFIRIKKCP